jgi:hypothetical protein
VMYTFVVPLILFCDGENVQKSVVPGLIPIGTIELSLSGIDSFDCRVTRCDSCKSSSKDSKIVPVSSSNNPLYMISFWNEFDALQNVANNVAKNRHSTVIGREDRERAFHGIIEMENDIRMLESLLRSCAGPHQTLLVIEKSTRRPCRD